MHVLRSSILLVWWIAVGLAIVVGATGSLWSVLASSNADTQVAATPRADQFTPVGTQVTDRTWSVRIDEATLTRDMNAWAEAQPAFDTPLGSARLHNLSAQLSSDQVLVQGNAEIGGTSAPFVLSADASVDSGRVLVHLRTARLGGVDLPGPVRGEIEQRLQDQLDQSTGTFQVVVQSVSTADGALVLRGTRQ